MIAAALRAAELRGRKLQNKRNKLRNFDMTDHEAIRAALKPFADEAKWWPKRWSDDVEVHVKSEGDKPNEYHVAPFKLGDLRRAAEAYAALAAINGEK